MYIIVMQKPRINRLKAKNVSLTNKIEITKNTCLKLIFHV
jgi:hypothetical protein